jgi:hypothetical protein
LKQNLDFQVKENHGNFIYKYFTKTNSFSKIILSSDFSFYLPKKDLHQEHFLQQVDHCSISCELVQ